MLFAFLAGMFAFLVTPREENPRIVVPAANIIVQKPGATPDEIEQLIIKPLEAILRTGRGRAHLRHGHELDGRGDGAVQVGQNKEDSLVKLYDRIMSNIDRMPPGTLQPLIKPADVDDVPILTISLSCCTGKCECRERQDVGATPAPGLPAARHCQRRARTPAPRGGHVARVRARRTPARHQRKSRSRPPARLQRHAVDIRQVVGATNVDIPSGAFVGGNRVASVLAGGMLKNATMSAAWW
jgi:multidrug efflux pump subunit AcrB